MTRMEGGEPVGAGAARNLGGGIPPGESLDLSGFSSLLDHLKSAGTGLRALSVDERIRALAAAARRARGLHSVPSEGGVGGVRDDTFVERMARVTGFSSPVIAAGLESLWAAVTVPELRRWFDAHGGPCALELAAVVAAGNIPGVAVFPAIAALLAGVPVLIKVSRAEPVVAPAWREALAQEAPSMAAAVGVVVWEGGNRGFEDRLAAAADRIFVFGSDMTIDDLVSRYGARIAGFGSGMSLAFVGPGADAGRAAEGIAVDLCLWDQEGCLSPRGVFVSGGHGEALAFARRLQDALQRVAAYLPAGARTPMEAARVRHFRAELEARRAAGEPVEFWCGRAGEGWTLACEPEPRFVPGCLGRTLTVRPLGHPGDLAPSLRPWRGQLQGAALDADPDTRAAWERELLDLGFSHITEPGRLQSPPLDWRNGGRDLLDELVGIRIPGEKRVR